MFFQYGIDLADATELIAHRRTADEVAQQINADAVIYQDLDDMTEACLEATEGESGVRAFEVGVFSGKYKTDVPEGYFEHLCSLRGQKKKKTNGTPLIANGPSVYLLPCQQDNGAVPNGLTIPGHRGDIK